MATGTETEAAEAMVPNGSMGSIFGTRGTIAGRMVFWYARNTPAPHARNKKRDTRWRQHEKTSWEDAPTGKPERDRGGRRLR